MDAQIAVMRSRMESVLRKAHTDGGRLRNIHRDVGEVISRGELDKFLAGAKKGTAPGATGVTIEMWTHGTDETKDTLLSVLNTALESGRIPNKWAYRLVRPLAKTATAAGLSDIRPITLLEVSQKVLTGILTARIMRVWTEHQVLHPNQMAFLNGAGCNPALERVRGVMVDCEDRNREGAAEAHMLFLDLAKA